MVDINPPTILHARAGPIQHLRAADHCELPFRKYLIIRVYRNQSTIVVPIDVEGRFQKVPHSAYNAEVGINVEG